MVTACGEDDTPGGDSWEFDDECGDQAAVGGEACDGADLRGRDCASFGYPNGELRCNDTCTGFEVAECSGAPDWSYVVPPDCLDCADDEICVDDQCVAICSDNPVEDETLSFDVPLHEVTGEVTFGGQAPSEELGEARLDFVNLDTESFERTSSSTRLYFGNGYGAELFPGTYDVYLRRIVDGRYFRARSRIASNVVIDGSRTLDFDLPELVSLELTLQPPVQIGEEELSGNLVLERLVDTGEDEQTYFRSFMSLPINEGQPLRVSRDVLPGRYRARFESDTLNVSETRAVYSAEPNFEVFGSRSIQEDTELSVPLELYRLSGRVSMAEGLPPESQPLSVQISRQRPDGGRWTTSLDQDGHFDVLVPSGNYEVLGSLGTFPSEGPHSTSMAVEVDADTSVDLTLGESFVEVRGRVEPAPDDDEALWLYFSNADGPSSTRHVEVNSGRFTTSMQPGRYRVKTSQIEAPDGTMRGLKLGEVEVEDEAAEDVVLQMGRFGSPVTLQGEITVEGQTMPDNSISQDLRGLLVFECADDGGCASLRGWQLERAMGADGAASYEVELVPGTYRVVFESAAPYPDRTQSDAVPPGKYVLDPHLEIGPNDTTRDFDMKTVRIDGEIHVNGQPLPSVEEFIPAEGQPGRGPLIAKRPLICCSTLPDPRTELPVEGPTRFELDVLPGFYTFELRLGGIEPRRSPHGPEFYHWLEAGENLEVDWNLPLHHVEVRLTHNGQAWPGAGAGHIAVRTQLGTFQTPINADGVAHAWWLGEDPTIIYQSEDASLRHGLMRLRQGCADLE